MQRRIIAAVAAVFLAGIGAILLYTYVNSAEARAMASMESTDVLVVTATVPAGTQGANLGPFVALKRLPRMSIAQGALTDTSSIADKVSITDMQVGEQVLPNRFSEPGTTAAGDVDVPSDLQLVSITLESARSVGSTLTPGDKIALLVTAPDESDDDKPVTGQAFRDVLVVNVQGGVASSEDDSTEAGGTLILTLALSPKDVSRVVWAAENAKLWTALEPKDGDHANFPVANGGNILK